MANSTKYAWMITADKIMGDTELSSVGRTGPRNHDWEKVEILRGERFRLLDDDGEVYGRGYINGNYTGMEPLDDWGRGGWGATEIEYYRNGEWVTL